MWMIECVHVLALFFQKGGFLPLFIHLTVTGVCSTTTKKGHHCYWPKWVHVMQFRAPADGVNGNPSIKGFEVRTKVELIKAPPPLPHLLRKHNNRSHIGASKKFCIGRVSNFMFMIRQAYCTPILQVDYLFSFMYLTLCEMCIIICFTSRLV